MKVVVSVKSQPPKPEHGRDLHVSFFRLNSPSIEATASKGRRCCAVACGSCLSADIFASSSPRIGLEVGENVSWLDWNPNALSRTPTSFSVNPPSMKQ
ncbi:hypothetical protein K443DRAFT_459278 [Laccaria amethystina LaAM-08-1]|uniref:Uncharacterized protein n=1 Tax=Laccaria amethystina LaAM-08-1 TaxID=1095629 RepID=A0A0C9WNN1_9AGAR|nr:hypothetical protein K443DRAFT_459278 [Laccaria amethystina LaAM-08-1]